MPKPAVLIDDTTNLYQVDDLLFRSEQLRAGDIALLKNNNIDAILNLRIFGQRSNHKLLKDLIDDTAISLCGYPLKTWYVTPQEVAEALTQIKSLQSQNKCVLVHCYHGANRTGIIVAMYRIIEQDWPIEQAKLEMVTGDFGYHPMWYNLRAMLNTATVDAVRAQM
ncbi:MULTISPECIES: dual specificity protein phosphatase family protein [Psychrobacter]|uniref:dual specificity protein phosphatase family protein n=1 Tax=Psychrobacter TaxID=497 RepID=UPI001919C2FF|nr:MULTISPECIES: dual specificity protein phosphatase family protein [Psychrobacter]